MRFVVDLHKAAPDGPGTHGVSVCAHCGTNVHRVPGGSGPVWVHTDTGFVVGPGTPLSHLSAKEGIWNS